MNLYQPTISGSLTVSGSVEIIGPFTMSGGSISGTSSFAANAGLLQGLDSTSFVGTGSFNTMSSSVSTRVTTIESKYATTGSNIFTGAQTVCANITSTGTIIAQTLNVQQVTSSVVYSSGSNTFGCDLSNVQQFTGSVRITGSLNVAGNTCVGGTITGTTVYGSTAICGGSVTGTCSVFSGNGLFGGSTNAGNAGTNTLSVGVPGTTAGGLQLWAATNQTHFIQFGDSTVSADNYRGYISYAHGTDTLALGSSSTDRLAITSTGIACFACRVCTPALTTTLLRVSDEVTYGLTICKGSGGYPIIQSDLGQSIGFYNGEVGGTYNERMRIWQTGIITIGCQVCVPQLTVSAAGGSSYNIANYFNTNSTTNSQTYFFIGQAQSTGRSGFVDWVDNTDCANGYIALGVNGDNPASGTGNGLMIKRGACVGINNNNPLRHLHVGPGSDSPVNTNNGVYISNNGITALTIRDSTNDSEFTTQVQSSGTILGTLTSHDLIIYSCNTERMRIANNGVTALCINSALVMAKGTVAQRPTAATGMMRYNSDYNLMEFYNGTSWVQMGSGDLATAQCINNTSMTHNVYSTGCLGLQGQGSACITIYGPATPSMGVYVGSNQFSTHGGHCGASDYPGYWAVNLGAAKAVNQLKIYMHSNSWGYFELAGSNNSGNGTNFSQCGTWTNLSFLCSTNGCQNMGGNSSGCSDGTVLTFWYTNDVPFQAYRIKVLDSSKPGCALGNFYGGSAGYVWVLNRV